MGRDLLNFLRVSLILLRRFRRRRPMVGEGLGDGWMDEVGSKNQQDMEVETEGIAKGVTDDDGRDENRIHETDT